MTFLNSNPPVPETPQPEVSQQIPPTPETVSPVLEEVQTQVPPPPAEVQALNEYLQNAYGVDLDGVFSNINQIQQTVQQQQIEANQNLLRREWGPEYDTRVKLIQEKMSQLPADLARSLDNIEGVKLLWQTIQAERQIPPPPGFPRGANQAQSIQGTPQFTVRASQLADPVQYKALAEKLGSQNPNWEDDLWKSGQVFNDLRR